VEDHDWRKRNSGWRWEIHLMSLPWLPFGYQGRGPRDGAATSTDITTGLKSYWLLNEATGTTAADSSGHSHDATLNSSIYWGADSIAFAGIAAPITRVSDHADFNVGATMTVFGWVNAASGVPDQILISQYDFGTANRGWTVSVDSSTGTTLRVYMSDDGSSGSPHVTTAVGSQTLFDSTWRSWALRFNAGAPDLFVNGAKDTSVTRGADTITSIFNAACDISFGSILNSGANSGALVGNQKKIRFYNVAKTDADIAAMHAVGP
jgi:hypothetical protein